MHGVRFLSLLVEPFLGHSEGEARLGGGDADSSLQMLGSDMRVDFYDFGARPRIELPDPASVYDATPTLERELDAGS